MKIIDDIIDGAVDDSVGLSSLLRKCLVVADKLQNTALKTWIRGELYGYAEETELPDYRVLDVNAVGFFIGTMGRQIRDQPLPASVMAPEHRHWATTAEMREPIAAYEALKAKTNQKGSLVVPWPGDLVVLYQRTWFSGQGFTLNRAHQVISTGAVVSLVDTIRTKLLDFCLELRRDIGTAEPTPQNPPPAVVEHHVTNIIFGGQTNVSGGSIGGDVIQGVNQNVVKGDFATLSGALKQIGFTDSSLGALKTALDEDAAAGHKTDIGPKVNGWLKSTVKALSKGTLRVGGDVTKTVVTTAILTFLGIGSAL